MGNVNCCHQNNNKNEENNKLYQINRNKYHGNKNNNKYQILSYDIEENILYKNYVKIPILASLEGISELNLNSKLYLCGSSSTNKDSSSYLFQINIQNLSSKIMVNSKYNHYYPSLIAINNDKILCVGGKNMTRCEIYDMEIDHWSLIPELPEERYKCTLCLDYKNKFIYLFGGINTQKNKGGKKVSNKNYIEKNNILRISIKNNSFPIWEKIFFEKKSENRLLCRISAAALFLEDNIILILGGENEEGKCMKNISKFDTKKLRVESSKHSLEFACKFNNQSTIVEYGLSLDERNIFYFFDSKNNIHIINKNQYSSNFYDDDEFQIDIKYNIN
jgi:hypothetical protein